MLAWDFVDLACLFLMGLMLVSLIVHSLDNFSSSSMASSSSSYNFLSIGSCLNLP